MPRPYVSITGRRVVVNNVVAFSEAFSNPIVFRLLFLIGRLQKLVISESVEIQSVEIRFAGHELVLLSGGLNEISSQVKCFPSVITYPREEYKRDCKDDANEFHTLLTLFASHVVSNSGSDRQSRLTKIETRIE